MGKLSFQARPDGKRGFSNRYGCYTCEFKQAVDFCVHITTGKRGRLSTRGKVHYLNDIDASGQAEPEFTVCGKDIFESWMDAYGVPDDDEDVPDNWIEPMLTSDPVSCKTCEKLALVQA